MSGKQEERDLAVGVLGSSSPVAIYPSQLRTLFRNVDDLYFRGALRGEASQQRKSIVFSVERQGYEPIDFFLDNKERFVLQLNTRNMVSFCNENLYSSILDCILDLLHRTVVVLFLLLWNADYNDRKLVSCV